MASSSSAHRLFLVSLVLVLSTASLLLLLPCGAAAVASSGEKDGLFFKTIYSIGDSIADTGNLVRESPNNSALPFAHRPYGETAFPSPTGRCSDGLLMIDYIATFFNLPLLSPYLDKSANFDHGVNFAVAGATALNSTFFDQKNIVLPFTKSSLDVQLDWFKTRLNSICHSKTECKEKLEQALFFVGEIGGNDYNYAFMGNKSIEEVKTYVPLVIERIINAAKEVIDAGAKYLVVPGNFPIGCMPVYLKMFSTSDPTAYDNKKCLKDLNAFAMSHNEQLQEALNQLRKEYPDLHILYADYYTSFKVLLDKAPYFGFNQSSLLEACCGTGDMTRPCGAPGVSVCPHPADHISWDGVHLTQAAYEIMVKAIIVQINNLVN